MIRYGQQDITQDDIDAVLDVLTSVNLTQGPKIDEFEQCIIDHCSVKYATAVNSATSALHIACLALEVGEGDYVWTSPNTFVASSNCALYCGAKIDFVDIDPRTYNLCPKKLEEKLIQAEVSGTLPKVVIPVHLSGQPCDMRQISKLAKRFGFKIIEDASHAIGGRYLNQPVGNCQFSDITVFSFHPVKIITTAEGGMATTNDPKIATKLSLFRSHGITRDSDLMVKPMKGPWDYNQIALGYNYRMSDIHAALGVSQISRLDDYVRRRHQIAQRYNSLLANLPITLPWQHPDGYSAYHLYVIRIDLAACAKTHLEVFKALRARDILVNLHYIPVHTQPYYRELGFESGDFPEAESYYAEAISIPMYPTLTSDEQDEVVNAIKFSLGI